ncbi:cytochrome c [Limimaricola sp. G21655-S1]|uniref:c-type cytochrome n=1 Tax=Limimaricola sp. G21655-S1 TaxID=3014768 RepID=UPI0022AEF9A3|nr:cytochrome c [Limimaricola sp. G21655-S1]MCZ4260087.1 cytochrome c [Limimaricola sp. G21655-S1]
MLGAGALALWPLASAAAEDGRQLYLDNCASCHGADLEGQPDWRWPLPSGRLPAPPHDATGHTWHHPDRVLREIILRGTAAVVGNGYESDMPGFEGLLTEAEVDAILDYLKSEWPERERMHQKRVTTADEAAGG